MMSASENRLIGLLCLMQTLFLASTFGAWIPVVSFSLLMLSLIVIRQRAFASNSKSPRRSRIPKWVRWPAMTVLFLVVFAAIATWRLAGVRSENLNPIYVGTDIAAHASLCFSFVVWFLFPQRGHFSMLGLGLVLVLLCVAGGGIGISSSAQMTVALASCIGFALASRVILGGSRNRRQECNATSDGDAKSVWLGPLFSLIVLSVLLMATSAIANVTNSALPFVQERLREQLQSSFRGVSDDSFIGGTRYVRGSMLGSIRRHLLGDPKEIALRIHSEYSPGYLRGHAFDVYRRQRWLRMGRIGKLTTRSRSVSERVIIAESDGDPRNGEGDGGFNRFVLHRGESATVQLEIHNDPLKGPVVFLPLTTHWIGAPSRELVVTEHNIVRLGVDVSKPYVAAVGLSPPIEEVNTDQRSMLLDVPVSLQGEVDSLVSRLCAGRSDAVSKATAISQYFQSNFGYTLDRTKTPRGVDPILNFLRETHDAHCEYFATATVLMLRRAGIPSRYVTGYVASEFNNETGFWLARNEDAHAWAEAYDDQAQQWFPVESTPGRSYQTVDSASASDQEFGLLEALLGSKDEDGANDDSWLNRFWGWLFSFRASEPLMLLFRVAQLPLFCVLVLVLWAKYLRPSKHGLEGIDHQSRQMLKRADRRLRRHSLVRSSGETLYQFSDRIEAFLEDPSHPIRTQERESVAAISAWYRDYANARYQGKVPKPLT